MTLDLKSFKYEKQNSSWNLLYSQDRSSVPPKIASMNLLFEGWTIGSCRFQFYLYTPAYEQSCNVWQLSFLEFDVNVLKTILST